MLFVNNSLSFCFMKKTKWSPLLREYREIGIETYSISCIDSTQKKQSKFGPGKGEKSRTNPRNGTARLGKTTGNGIKVHALFQVNLIYFLIRSRKNIKQTYTPNEIIPSNVGLDFLVDKTLKTDGEPGLTHSNVRGGIGT